MKQILILFLLIALISCKSNSNGQSSNEKMETPSLEKATAVSYQNLNVLDFSDAISKGGEIAIIDVRTPEETSAGIIEGAMELNFYDKDFANKILALNKSKPYYIYCKAGGRSAKTAQLMVKNGFTEVFNLEGGYTKWSEEKK